MLINFGKDIWKLLLIVVKKLRYNPAVFGITDAFSQSSCIQFLFEELELRLYKRVPICFPSPLSRARWRLKNLSLFPYVCEMSYQGRGQARALYQAQRARRAADTALSPAVPALLPAVPVPAGQCAVLPAGAARGSCGPGRSDSGTAPALPRRPGRRPVPGSFAGKQTWPARETRRTLRTTWAITCRSFPVTVWGLILAARGGEARGASGAAGPGRRAGGAEPARGRGPGTVVVLAASRLPLVCGRGFGEGGGCPQRQELVLSILCVPRTWLQGNGVKLGGERGRLGPPSIPDFSGTSSPATSDS